MAYTIPEYVDTQEQAILAVASAVKGEQVTGGDGSVNTALDILADALAGQDVTVPMTDQGAILALAQYVAGGGGGDFTTATVTLQAGADYSNAMFLNCSCINSDEQHESTSPAFYTEDTSAEFTAVLYKGKALAACSLDATITTTGSVEYDQSEQTYTITGDCAFTFAGGK